MRVLVTGGTGYIGSHTVVGLLQAQHEVVILDNLSNSKISTLDRIREISGITPEFVNVDLVNTGEVDDVFRHGAFDGVIHFAGLKSVAESVNEPLRYYQVNLGGTMSVAYAAARHGVSRIVFSSSSTVYGPDASLPYAEDDDSSLQPLNPYGWTKLMSERVLADTARASEVQAINLRYFNPVGAHRSGLLGEDPLGTPNNLMPLVSEVARGDREALQIFGRDYPTTDGTCLRDYIHVEDLAVAHVVALEHFAKMNVSERAFNIGTGKASSVLELVDAFERATGVAIPHEFAPRRSGDAAASWADASRAAEELGWTAERTLDDACSDTWRWVNLNPAGLPG